MKKIVALTAFLLCSCTSHDTNLGGSTSAPASVSASVSGSASAPPPVSGSGGATTVSSAHHSCPCCLPYDEKDQACYGPVNCTCGDKDAGFSVGGGGAGGSH